MSDPIIHRAAGIMFVTADGKALFLKRGDGGDAPGSWCFPGGTTEGDEMPSDTAKREALEELGEYPKGDIKYHTRAIAPVVTMNPSIAPGAISDFVDFTTFIQKVENQFTPKLNGEHTGYAWAPLVDPPQPMHPGCQIAIDRLTMDELGVAVAMSTGRLTSPQLYGNMHLFDMRITGTGVAYRNEKKDADGKVLQKSEFVYRRPENYLTNEFVQRCNGLQVIMMHPDKAVLDSKEFAARTVGAMMLPYIKGDEVWGIAKIYDDDAVEMLTSSQMSTSPGVILGGGDQRFTTEDGTPLLIEGKPALLDHLAICERGVWDKGGEPYGVRTDSSTTHEEFSMTDEDKKILDKQIAESIAAAFQAQAARADDNNGKKLDKMLSGLDSFSKRMDAFEKKMDAMEEKDKKADAEGCERMDGESDEDFKKRSDAFEKEKKADAEEGKPEKVAADKKDSDEKDIKKMDKKDADEEDDKKKADAALTAENKELKDRLASIEAGMGDMRKQLPKQITDSERHDFVNAQSAADEVYNAFGKRAPYPLTGESVFEYRRRLAHNLKDHSAKWKDTDVLALDSLPIFTNVEKDIFADSIKAAKNPSDLGEGELREIPRIDSATGQRLIEWAGNKSFIARMKRAPRYVKRINVGATN